MEAERARGYLRMLTGQLKLLNAERAVLLKLIDGHEAHLKLAKEREARDGVQDD